MKLLIDKGFAKHINRNTPSGTALWCACGNAKDRIVEILLKHGADPDVILRILEIMFQLPCQGTTPMQQAIKRGDRKCFDLLIQYGAKHTPQVHWHRIVTGAGFSDI